MGFSRQEYWSGVPLPSPEDNIRKCTKVHRDVADSSPGSRFESYLRSGRTTLVTQTVKNLPAMQEIQVQSLGQEVALEKGMVVPYSSILVWRIPWMEKPGGLQSMGSQRVRHN